MQELLSPHKLEGPIELEAATMTFLQTKSLNIAIHESSPCCSVPLHRQDLVQKLLARLHQPSLFQTIFPLWKPSRNFTSPKIWYERIKLERREYLVVVLLGTIDSRCRAEARHQEASRRPEEGHHPRREVQTAGTCREHLALAQGTAHQVGHGQGGGSGKKQ